MELTVELKNATEKMVERLPKNSLVDKARRISNRYMTESGTGKSLVNENDDAIVYSLMRMPATFTAVSTIMEKICEVSDVVCRTLLDVGAGTGAASWAVNNYFNLDKITCLEREKYMSNIGKGLMEQSSESVLRNSVWIAKDLVNEARSTEENLSYQSDIVLASYVLNEMTEEDRIKVAKWLWKNTKEVLVIVEPGTPVGYGNIRRIRDALLESGAHILAPCTYEGKCHIVDDTDWCHFTCRVQRGKIHRILKEGDAPYEDEKFSYIVVSRYPKNIEKEFGRVMRHPKTEKGKITFTVCDEECISTKVVTKKETETYKKAKKVTCGDLIELHSKRE